MKKNYMTPQTTEERLKNGFPVLFGEGDSENKEFGDDGDDDKEGFDTKQRGRNGLWSDTDNGGSLW